MCEITEQAGYSSTEEKAKVNAGQVCLISHGRKRAETPTEKKHREEGQRKQEHREQQRATVQAKQ